LISKYGLFIRLQRKRERRGKRKAEAQLKESYVPKLSKVLPAKKVSWYIQIENKIRALIRYELAGGIPLVN
jgi:hypothetical protein